MHRCTRVGRRVLRGAIANAFASSTVSVVESLGERWMYTDRKTCCLAFRTGVNQARDQPFCSACPVLPAEETRALFARATAAYAARRPRSAAT